MADLTLRPALAVFVQEMERILRENDYKKQRYLKVPVMALFGGLEAEVLELGTALRYETEARVAHEAVDVANFAMLIWKRLEQKETLDGV